MVEFCMATGKHCHPLKRIMYLIRDQSASKGRIFEILSVISFGIVNGRISAYEFLGC